MLKKRKDLNLIFGSIILLFFLAVMIVSFFYTPYPANEMNIAHKLEGPSMAHWLGTDKFGRDILSRIMVGTQTAFFVGTFVTVSGLIVGTIIGGVAGYVGGWVDEVIMRLIDALMAFPGIVLAIMLIAVFGAGLMNTSIALGILAVPTIARIARSGFLKQKEQDYVLAAQAIGLHPIKIIFREILPNIYSSLIVAGSVAFAVALLAVSSLSYLGLGVQPPDPSLGRMLNNSQGYLISHPIYTIAPGAAITFLVLGFYMLSNGIRNLTDSRTS